MARRRRRGRLGRLLGGVLFLAALGGAFWWGLSLVRSGDESEPQEAKRLAGTIDPPTTPTVSPPTSTRPLRSLDVRPPNAPVTPPAPLSPRPTLSFDPGGAQTDYQAGVRAFEQDPVRARQLLSDSLSKGLGGSDAVEARRRLNELAERMIFSRARTPGDPLVLTYVVKKGDTAARIAAAHGMSEDLLVQINQLRNRNLVREHQTLKVVRGPFHALVDKSDHEMYMLLGEVFVCDFRVGLGANGGTPTGKWLVINHLTDPSWVDPQTGKRWHAQDPQNPIGEYWIGLKGIEGDAKDQVGFGVHGTIDESSIGKDASMGCIRLGAQNIAKVYKLLVPGKSTITVRE